MKGIALIQVLLLSAMISVFALHLSHSAKQQIEIAQLEEDRAQAQLQMRTAESQLAYTLLTQQRRQLEGEQLSSITQPIVKTILQRWNFHNKPFSLNESVSIQIQDQNALISVNYPRDDLLLSLFDKQPLAEISSRAFIDTLLDWQDSDSLRRMNGAEASEYEFGPRNANITLLADLLHFKGVTSDDYKILSTVLTPYMSGPFNPLDSPGAILYALIGEDAKKILELRDKNELTTDAFIAITQIYESETLIMYPGKIQRITLQAKVGGAELVKQMVWKIEPTAQGIGKYPLVELESKW